MSEEGDRLYDVFMREAAKEEAKKMEDAVIQDIVDRPEAMVDTIKNIDTTQIRSQEKVDVATNLIKGIKQTLKVAKDAKATAIKPWEEKRKAADAALKEARAGKKKAGDKYTELIQTAEGTERALRDNISEYATYLTRKEEEERRKQAEALAEAQRKAEEQQKASEKFLETGDAEDLAKVEQLGQEAKESLKEAQEAEQAANEAPQETVQNVAMREDVAFEVADINVVPDRYFSLLPDAGAIAAKLKQVFPGITFEINTVRISDPSAVLDEFVHESLDEKRVLDDLKKDKDLTIPGIVRTCTKVPIVR
jgi:hypothetical protein